MGQEYISLREAARALQVSQRALLLTVRCGKISARRVRGRALLIRASDLLPFTDPLAADRSTLVDGA